MYWSWPVGDRINGFSRTWFFISLSDAIPCACCLGSFSHQLSECILNAKATSHMAPTQEASGQRYSSCLCSKQESKQSNITLVWPRKASCAVMFWKKWKLLCLFDRYTRVAWPFKAQPHSTCLRDKLLPLMLAYLCLVGLRKTLARFSSFNSCFR